MVSDKSTGKKGAGIEIPVGRSFVDMVMGDKITELDGFWQNIEFGKLSHFRRM